MKKQLKAALATTLALIMALALMPVSALPRFDTKAEMTPSWTVPAGYNVHDYTKCVEFLEQTDEYGVKNGEKLSGTYDPNDPSTWGMDSYSGSCLFFWMYLNGEQRINTINVINAFDERQPLVGSLDVSGCTALYSLMCYGNSITELNVTGCTALADLSCAVNSLTALDISNNTALRWVFCGGNELIELNASGCTALEQLSCEGGNLVELNLTGCAALDGLECGYNSLAELDVTGCTALRWLHCQDNCLTELDVSNCASLEWLNCSGNMLGVIDLNNNPNLTCEHIQAVGSGFIGYDGGISTGSEGYIGFRGEPNGRDYIFTSRLTAVPQAGADFEGFYDDNGALISLGEWDDQYGAYVYAFESALTGSVFARFSGGFTPGDVDGNGSVSVADAITTLRLAMGLSDDSGLNSDAADMDGNGSITISDAITIMRIAMGLV